jgi:hypothetical protein
MVPLTEPETFFGIAQLHPDTDPQTVAAVLERERPDTLQFNEQLPGDLLDTAADALRAFPEVCLRVYGDEIDPSLGWLARFDHVRCLSIDCWDVKSFDVLGSFRNLERLGLGATASKRPSLAFLRQLPRLARLGASADWRDFDAVGDVRTLRQLSTNASASANFGVLRAHPALEVLELNFGSNRDLSALADMPRLRALELYQIQRLDENDLSVLGDCASLVVLSLGALRNVRHLAFLRREPSQTLRYLIMERMRGLRTLADVGECEALEQVYLAESKPEDGRLDLLARAKRLEHLASGDHYSKEQRDAAEGVFRGRTLWTRGEVLRGDPKSDDVVVAWRRPVGELLALADA